MIGADTNVLLALFYLKTALVKSDEARRSLNASQKAAASLSQRSRSSRWFGSCGARL